MAAVRSRGRRRGAVPFSSTLLLMLAFTMGAGLSNADARATSDRAAAAAGAPGADAAGTAGKGLPDELPSIQYEQARDHAGDRSTVTPGDRVTVPFRPRAGDTNLVDGHLPVALPAGRVSGRDIAASAQGSVWSPATIDGADGPTSFAPAAGDAGIVLASYQQPVAEPAALPAATNVLRREVVGFLPHWELGTSINYGVLSTVVYFGVGLDSAGNLIKRNSDGSVSTEWARWTGSSMTTVINNAHSAGTRVDLSVELFAWDGAGIAAQQAMLGSATARQNAASQIAAAVRDRGADGVNVDFEPIASGQSANFVTFVRTLRTELNKIKAGYQILIDTTGYVGNYDADALVATGAADALFIMGYDFRTASAANAGSISPITSPTVYDLSDAVNAFRAQVPASKIILGLPYYGRAWSTTTSGPNGKNQSGSTYGGSVAVEYGTAVGLAAQYGRKYDSVEQSAWTVYQGTYGTSPSWREAYYDDAQSLGAKYDMINYWGLRGTGIWALGYEQGRTELAQVLANKFLTDKSAPEAGILPLSPVQGNEGFAVSWRARDDWNGVKSYDIQVAVDGGAYAAWLTGTSATSATYQGKTGHRYAFRVRATDGVGNVGAWDVSTSYSASPALTVGGYIAVSADQLNERSAPDTSATVVKKATAGTLLQILAGPASADGYTWYQVTGPVLEVGAVTPMFPGCWVAVSGGGSTFAVPVTAPNTTSVSAAIGSVVLGRPELAAVGTAATFSPNGDGALDTLPLSWVNDAAFDTMSLSVYRKDGSVAGSLGLGARGAGTQRFDWNGTAGGSTKLADGQYLLMLTGTRSSGTYEWPSNPPFNTDQWTTFAVTIDTSTALPRTTDLTGAFYHPITPARILDTRKGINLSGPFKDKTARKFAVVGRAGIPAGTVAVTGNVTVSGQTAPGYVYLASTVTTRPGPTLYFPIGVMRASGVTVPLASDGTLSAIFVGYSGSSTNVIFDVTGYFTRGNGAGYTPIAAKRVVDTQPATTVGLSGKFLTSVPRRIQVAGLPGLPSTGLVAVTGNVTLLHNNTIGYAYLGPTQTNTCTTQSINAGVQDAITNTFTVPVGSDGAIWAVWKGAASGSSTDLVLDITGFYTAAGGTGFHAITPVKLLDSRSSIGVSSRFSAGTPQTFSVVTAASHIPSGAVAITGSLGDFQQTAAGQANLAPDTTTIAKFADITFPKTDLRANGVTVGITKSGGLSAVYAAPSGSTTILLFYGTGFYR